VPHLPISEHGARSCVYAEGEAIVRKHKATPEEVAVQLNKYRTEGLPLNATFRGRKGKEDPHLCTMHHESVVLLCWLVYGLTCNSCLVIAALAEASIIVREHDRF